MNELIGALVVTIALAGTVGPLTALVVLDARKRANA